MNAEGPECAGRDLAALSDRRLWYAEDLGVGDWMDLGTVSISQAEITAFAHRFDPLPIHLDPTNRQFGGVVASGIHTMALYASLASRQFLPRLALLAGKGLDRLRLPNPVRPGAVLTGWVGIDDVVMGRGRADIHSRSTLVDAHGNVVLSFVGIQVVARRGHPVRR
ncbi:MaoC/PaaZ C-terminal domain-containing protein [Mycolicibacterium palauense]|uniref:MaoC/PaaZ C-terminal domain-containing protein n=1 Tax=Mycolicibacterium palauense TaxID=2034511 RepID=UPI000BFF1964|nr:MaoC/PaaZ C-terminal domain-containing protein [Mycolicibacterium palauense]